MKLKKALFVLDMHQQWRLGAEEIPMVSPKFLTEAIDVILKHHSRISKEELSDEKIINEARNYENYNPSAHEEEQIVSSGKYHGFLQGAKWYREQIKQRTNG